MNDNFGAIIGRRCRINGTFDLEIIEMKIHSNDLICLLCRVEIEQYRDYLQ